MMVSFFGYRSPKVDFMIKSFSPHDQRNTCFFFNIFCFKKRRKARRRRLGFRHPRKKGKEENVLLRKPMCLLTPQESRTNGPSGQDVDEFRLIWEYVQY